MNPKYTVLDTFSGAGGLSEGFFQQGFKFVSHIEKDDRARASLETRAIYHALKNSNHEDIYRDYISGNLNRDEFLQKFKDLELPPAGLLLGEVTEINENPMMEKIQEHLKVMDSDSVDVIIGGPPCQAYSLAGRSRDPNGMKSDPRNYLYKHYLAFINKFEPKLFVFENVPGLISAKKGSIYTNLHHEVEKLGYKTEARILNAKNFSVLQERKRIIFIGWKKEYDFSYPLFPEKPPEEFHVSDILKDLPSLQPGEGTDDPVDYKIPFSDASRYLKKFNIRKQEDKLIQHKARIHNPQDRNIYKLVISKWNQDKKRLKYTDLPSELQSHNRKDVFLDRFKVVDMNGCSHSVVAHIAKDGHHFIHPDIEQIRSLTVREVARIQSFPDNYKFEGPRTSQYSQIGNAVPPLMAKGIAIEIEKMLKEIL
ncbi:DNA cytosine methyltransferase [Methanosarcina sp. 1.H.A.2.2]|uniref:DNA cytosine methyltransferase n=1 Tax=Methanosarcina sp. 1.H.A.2.2 TaxID=1483601 RepID=UPI0006223899|nr:DNA cytosine methyltransferase [Methanosarcina sp. 1.H.A.2.2]KKH45790.1 cytosine methyltransferase [Methanosarcina sp. 1.H.A.2.2]